MALRARSLGRLQSNRTALLVSDVQERFRSILHCFNAVAGSSALLCEGASSLNLPVLVTEQAPEKLGRTVDEVHSCLPSFSHRPLPKHSFSMLTHGTLAELRQHINVDQVILCGLETHVCVLQSALDLLSHEYEVHVAADATSSQRESDRSIALNRMMQSGVFVSSSEAILMQLVGGADSETFKPISKLLKKERDTIGM